MLPRVILHNEVSVDGRIDRFTPNIALFYEVASHWKEDATLAGCDTLLKAMEAEQVKNEANKADKSTEIDPKDSRPLLVIPDSSGRLKNWNYWRKQPYWRDGVALCSLTTPKSHLDYLQEQHISTIVAGDDHVDLKKALKELYKQYEVKIIRVDSGGTLNGALLRAGLVDEISVLLNPCLVGSKGSNSLFKALDLTESEGTIQLLLTHMEKLKDEVVWLRYETLY
ncbi:MAG: RibD family protein [Candidatus Aminicenantes bacterium]|jgi:2,5-diamino-6-(ribosylamino)-4(3H)-pyrimidinone 5'-phosphate reductase